MVCECGHNKKDHENGLDYGRNGYLCTKCNCSHFAKKTFEDSRKEEGEA